MLSNKLIILAFMESGEPTEFLAMLLLHSQNSKNIQTATINEASSSYSTELCEVLVIFLGT